MVNTNTNIENPGDKLPGRDAEIAKLAATEKQEFDNFKVLIAQGKIKEFLDVFVGKLPEFKGEVPQAKVDKFMASLNPQEKADLKNFIVSGSADPRAGKLHVEINKVRGTLTTPEAAGIQVNAGAQQIAGLLDQATSNVDLSSFGALLDNPIFKAFGVSSDKLGGLKGGAIKSFLLVAAAKFIESASKSFGEFGAQVLDTSKGLRMLSQAGKMTKEQLADYDRRYTAWMENPSGNPPPFIEKKKPAKAGAYAEKPAASSEAVKVVKKEVKTDTAGTDTVKIELANETATFTVGGKKTTFAEVKDIAVIEPTAEAAGKIVITKKDDSKFEIEAKKFVGQDSGTRTLAGVDANKQPKELKFEFTSSASL